MKKTFNFQELIKYIEDNEVCNCVLYADGVRYHSLADLLTDLSGTCHDYAVMRELSRKSYELEVKGMTFEEALAEYRAYNDIKFDVYRNGNLYICSNLPTILSLNPENSICVLLNEAEFFIA